jgi:hypothetical protein
MSKRFFKAAQREGAKSVLDDHDVGLRSLVGCSCSCPTLDPVPKSLEPVLR